MSFGATIRVRDTCLCLAVQRGARRLARHFDEVLRPVGLTHGQFSLLNALNRPVPARIGQVTELLAMDRTTLTANLKPLERRGLVLVGTAPDDRRGRILSLTLEGSALLAKALPLWDAAHATIERDLAGEADRLRENLRRLAP